jgi:hypothetical protein
MSKNDSIKKVFFESLSVDEREGIRRFKGMSVFPRLVRPDLVIDDKGKLWITEIDLVPAFAGMLQRMQEIYGQRPTIAELWTRIIPDKIVVSIPRWKPFVSEQKFFVQRVREKGGQIEFLSIEEWEKLHDYKGIIFKNCCTLDLLNNNCPPYIPSKAIFCPPLILDWKGWMALAHQNEILKRLRLSKRIPETYLLPLQPRRETKQRRELIDLPKRKRDRWILKPVVSWGARRIKEGRGYNLNNWNNAIIGVQGHVSRGIILQEKIVSACYERVGLITSGDVITLKNLNIRVSPYYIFWKGKSVLAGVLITLRNSIRVHGARDAIITIGVQA